MKFCHFEITVLQFFEGGGDTKVNYSGCVAREDSTLHGSIQKRQYWFRRTSTWKEINWLKVIMVFEKIKGNDAYLYGEQFKVRKVIIVGIVSLSSGVGNSSAVVTPKLWCV